MVWAREKYRQAVGTAKFPAKFCGLTASMTGTVYLNSIVRTARL